METSLYVKRLETAEIAWFKVGSVPGSEEILFIFNLSANIQLMKRDIVTAFIYCYVHRDQISFCKNMTLAAFQRMYAERCIWLHSLYGAGLAWLVIGEFCICLYKMKKHLDLLNEYKVTYVKRVFDER